VLAVANAPRFAALPPTRIVPMLAEDGTYLASESTCSRLLRADGQAAHRGRVKAPRPPTTHIATGPRQGWYWDNTYLPAQVKGHGFFPHQILVLHSRKIVGREVHADDHADHVAHPVHRTTPAEVIARATKPELHGDNWATLKATTVLSKLQRLGINPLHPRPRRGDDDAYAESLCRAVTYRPELPADGSVDLAGAREWASTFVHWDNHERRHSGIRHVSPAQRHAGDDGAILAARHALYLRAREQHTARWSGSTRNWSSVGTVTLNPERDSVINASLANHPYQPLVA
jgi:transposase InsO family protein